MRKRIEEIILQAIEKNELERVLDASEDYVIDPGRYNSASVPTEWIPIVEGIHQLHEDMPQKKINVLFEDALFKLYEGTAYQVYCAMMVLFIHIQQENTPQGTFHMNLDIHLVKLKQALLRNQSELSASKEWLGFRHEDGLWGEAKRVDRLLNKYGLELGLLK